MSSPQISVIIPIYNAASYLHSCVDCVLAQDFVDFELLLVDDGSKDISVRICDEYAEKDKRVKVFHKENGGVSSARNVGLDNACGEWVTFVDADDLLCPGYLSEYSKHFDIDADLYIQGFEDSEGNILCYDKHYWTGDGIACKLKCLEEKQLNRFVWNKLFRVSIIKTFSIRFDENITMLEDLLFVYQYLFYAKSVLNLAVTNYFYSRHATSASFQKHKFSSWNLLLDKFDEVFLILSEKDREYALEQQKTFFLLSLDVVRSLYIDGLKEDIRISFLRKIKKRGQSNPLVAVARMYTFFNKIITFLLLYLPVNMTDKVLYSANKVLFLRR